MMKMIKVMKMMTSKQKDYFTTRQAAKLLGVAVSTIQLWTNNGLLKAWTTTGGHRRITRSSALDLHNKQQAILNDKNPGKNLSIVVVEDDPQQLRLYEKQLLGWSADINLVLANDGYDGLVKIGITLPDIIITDLNMPNIDGFQMINRLKNMPALDHSLFIVITGLLEDEIKARGGLPKGVHCYTKPVQFKELEPLFHQKVQSMTA